MFWLRNKKIMFLLCTLRGGSGVDPGWGVHIYKEGFDLLILPEFLLIFPDFLKILNENKIILSQRGVGANHLNPL